MTLQVDDCTPLIMKKTLTINKSREKSDLTILFILFIGIYLISLCMGTGLSSCSCSCSCRYISVDVFVYVKTRQESALNCEKKGH